MFKTFCRIYPFITSIPTRRHFVPIGTQFPNSRCWCNLTQQDAQQENAILKFTNKPVQNNLQTDNSDENELDIHKQQDAQQENAILKFINKPDQNNLQKDNSDENELDIHNDESEKNALDKPAKRRRQFQHPQSLTEAVYRSEFLRNMVDIGVNLYEIQKLRPRDFDFIVSLRTWDPDPPGRIRFLIQLGVQLEYIPKMITKNPWILKENLEDMQVRVNYLLSKKFHAENIAKMVSECPKLLTMKTRDIDSRLGYFQHGFKLNGNQVRHLASTYPWMISLPEKNLRDTLDTLKDVLSFNMWDMKELILNNGKIWKLDAEDLKSTAEFLHYELKMSHKKIVQYGHLLTKARLGMQYRYNFMVFMNRANFDPTKPNYYSYDILWEGTLEDFCEKLHTSMEALDLFAKSV